MPADLQKARELFLHAVGKLPPEQWDAYVSEACGGDAELEQQVGQLLRVHREAGSFLDRPAAAEGATGDSAPAPGEEGATGGFTPVPGEEGAAAPPGECPGTLIGPYKLLQQIGEGGMGTVFLAEQQHPVRRTVALKVIKAGMDSRQVIARFEAERQALAMMDHVNIARVLDAGATESGRPYFVMELVHGVPITKYCDDNRLTPRERLELFVPVCQAIQHAHQKGIIHRDLKPSNVMITLYDGKPVPKVIDFGVAKATEQRLTERTLFTQYGTMVGTPEYMSPEQAEMSAAGTDTRSDILSLGVLLYELLTGSTPLSHTRILEATYGEILRMIKEEEAPKPSTRLSDSGAPLASISAHRHTEPAKLVKLLRGELDWIVMKCLEKDRNRRYETANDLAMDLQRYLADEPVQACPPTMGYRFRKFNRKHRNLLMIVAAFAALLLIATGLSSWQWWRAEQHARAERTAREQAEANFQRARSAVDDYFTTVSQSKLFDVPGLQPLRRDLLESAVRYYRALADGRGEDPSVRAGLAVAHFRLAEVYYEVGLNDQALASLDAGLDVAEDLMREHAGDADLLRRLAGFWKGTRRMPAAEASPLNDVAAAERVVNRFLRTWQTLARANTQERAFRSDLAVMYDRVGQILDNSGRRQEALDAAQQAGAIWEELVRDYPREPEYLFALGQGYDFRAFLFRVTGRPGQESECVAKAIDVFGKLATANPGVAPYREELAGSLTKRAGQLAGQKNIREAEKVYRRALDVWDKLAAEYPHYRLQGVATRASLANVLSAMGQIEEAEKVRRQGLELEGKLAADVPATPEGKAQVARAVRQAAYGQTGKPREKLFRQSARRMQELADQGVEPQRHRLLAADSWINVAFVCGDDQRHEEEISAYRKAIELRETLSTEFLQKNAFGLRWPHRNLAAALRSVGRSEEWEPVIRRAIATYEKRAAEMPGEPSFRFDVAVGYRDMVELLLNTGKQSHAARRLAEAEQWCRRAIALVDRVAAEAPANSEYRMNVVWWRTDLAVLLRKAGREKEAA